MDDSLGKALIIAGGVLLGMMVIAFMAFSFREMSSWSTTQDDEIKIEQTEKFNKEYEVYDKNLMYGVDVISCLNKAKSNNDKIKENSFSGIGKYDASYEVKVTVTLNDKKPLEESIVVSYLKQIQNDEKSIENDYLEGQGPKGNIKLGSLDGKNKTFSFIKKDYIKVSNFNASTALQTQRGKKIKESKFELTAEGNGENEEILRCLLSSSDLLSEVVKNSDSSTNAKSDGWSKAEFKSALYDLKTRKFRCTNLSYSADTGRINQIEFVEFN